MKNIHEAAEYLGVSESRVRQLIKVGLLTAEKIKGTWFVSENSLDDRLATVRNGRPTKAEARAKANSYLLMNRTHEVARVQFSRELCRFCNIELLDEERLPFSMHSYQAKDNRLNTLNDWWGHRAIPDTRAHIETRIFELEEAARAQGNTDRITTATIPLASLGLSLSDQYWLKPLGSDVAWEDVNFFHNDFELGPLLGKESSSEWMNSVGLKSPDNTTDGQLPKRWLLDEWGHRCLVKGSANFHQEACNELIATRLYRRLLRPADFVEYRLAHWRGKLVSVCETFLADDEEFIPALYLYLLNKKPNSSSEFGHYYKTCEELDVEDAFELLEKMIVCDYILANQDRHWRNFGVIRNVDTLKMRAAPIFDTGTCLWSDASINQLRYGSYEFTSKPFFQNPERQLALVKDSRWFDPKALDGFDEEAHEILEEYLGKSERNDLICRGLRKRIDLVKSWYEHAPKPVFSNEHSAHTEIIDWVW